MNIEEKEKRRKKLLSILHNRKLSDGGKVIVERQLKKVNKGLSTLERWTK